MRPIPTEAETVRYSRMPKGALARRDVVESQRLSSAPENPNRNRTVKELLKNVEIRVTEPAPVEGTLQETSEEETGLSVVNRFVL